MKKGLGALLWNFFSAFCFATLLAELLLACIALQRGWFRPERLQLAKEAFYGVRRQEIRTRLASTLREGGVRAEEEVAARANRIRDLPLRSQATRRDAIEFGVERSTLQIDHARYEQTRIGFDKALREDMEKVQNAALDTVQSLMEQLSPQAAKEHLMLMLTAPGDNDPKQAMQDVVEVMRRLSPDRRRKIFSEFQSREEAAQVEAMLRAIRELELSDAKPPGGGGGLPP
jgi:hypothetical protein